METNALVNYGAKAILWGLEFAFKASCYFRGGHTPSSVPPPWYDGDRLCAYCAHCMQPVSYFKGKWW